MKPVERPVQTFSDAYLEHCATLSPDEIARFLEDFRLMHAPEFDAPPSRAISMRVPVTLLHDFRRRCAEEGVRYQTQIKRLMQDWLERRS